MRVINRVRSQHPPVAAQECVRLFARDEQQIAIGNPGGAFEIDLLLHEPLGSGISRIGIVMEIAEVHDVDPQGVEHIHPWRPVIESRAVSEQLVEVQMEVAGQHFVAGQSA